jgi:hypothetical protein
VIGRGPTPPVPVRFYAYVVVDKSQNPPAPLTIKLSRQACNEFRSAQPNAAELRVRRAKVTLFDS